MNQVIKHGIQMVASLDPASQKTLRSTLEEIFSEAGKKLDFNTGEARTSIQNLAKAFQSIFEQAGNTSIDFSKLMKMPSDQMFKELGTIAATQFWDAWNAVSSRGGAGGIVNGVKQQLDALTKERDKKMSEYEKASKMYDRYDNAMGLRYMESDEFTPLHKQKDINKQAYDVMDHYGNSLAQLEQLERGAKGYNVALLQAFESYEKLFKMKATLDLHDGPISEDVLSMYGDKQLKGLTAPFLQQYGGDMEKIGSKALDHYQSQMSQISSALTDIDGKMSAIQQKSNAESGVDKTLIELKQIEAAYDRILNKSGSINKAKSNNIQAALDYTPKGSDIRTLDALSRGYEKSFSSNENWEQQYQWLTKFVKEYDAYASNPNADQTKLEQYKALYQQLQPMAENARNMLQNVLNMANNVPLVGMGGAEDENASVTAQNAADAEERARIAAEAKAKANQESANAEAKARVDAEAKANADAEQAAAAEKEKLAQEEAARTSRIEAENTKLTASLKEQMVSATKQQVAVMSGDVSNAKESMSLVGSSGILSTVQGQDYAVDAATMVNQLVANLKNSIVMSLHDHPNAMDAFTPSDINSFAKLYYDQGAKVNGIIANGVIKTIDFTGISKELAIKIGQSFSANLSRVAQETGLFSFDQGNIIPKPEVDALAQSDPDKYRTIMDGMIDSVNVSLDEAFRQNGLESTVKTFTTKQLPELTQYLLEVQRTGQDAVTPIERLKNILLSIKPNQSFDWNSYAGILSQFESGTIDGFEAINQINAQLTHEADAANQAAQAINTVTQAQENLNNIKSQEPNQVDDSTQIQNETSATTQHTQSYEQLCQVVERYNQLVAQKGIRSLDDVGAFEDIATQLDGVISEDMLKQFQTPLDAGALAQQLGIEIPQAANAAKQAVDDLSGSLEKKNAVEAADNGASEAAENSAETESLQQQNKVLQENIDLKSKSNVQTGATTGTVATQGGVATDGGADVSSEASQLTNLQDILASVTTAVIDKTNAFTAEEAEVKRVVESEIASLDMLEQKVLSVKGAMAENGTAGTQNPYLLTDANGKALTVYRGVRDSLGGLVSDRTGTFGTDNFDVARGYTHGNGKVFAYNVEMHNPLEIQAKGSPLKQIKHFGNAFEGLTNPIIQELQDLYNRITVLKEKLKTASGFEKNATIPSEIDKLQKRIDTISADESHVYGIGGTDLFARKAKNNGYDGVIFRDLIDPSTGSLPSERVPSNIIVTFNEQQMRLLDTLPITSDQDVANNTVNTNIDTINAEKQAVDSLNASLQQKSAIENVDNSGKDASEEMAETEAIKQQNVALKENISLTSQANGQDVIVDGASVVPQAANTAADEIGSLNTVKAKVEEITAAVNTKTQAFFAEEKEVARVVGAEIQSLDLLEKKVLSIKGTLEGLLSNLKTGQSDIGAGIGNITVTVNNSDGVDTEQKGLWALDTTVQSVKTALDLIRTELVNVITAIGNINTQQTTTTASSVTLATEATLGAIKSVLDVINGKIVAGTKGGSGQQSDGKTESTSEKKATKSKKAPDGADTSKKGEAAQAKHIEALQKEIGVRQGALNNTTNDGVRQALQEEIALREEIIRLIQKGSAMSSQEEARQITDLSEKTKAAKAAAKEEEKAQKKAAADQQKAEKKSYDDFVKKTRKEAGMTQTQSTMTQAGEALKGAALIDNATPEATAKFQQLDAALQQLNATYTEINNKPGPVDPDDQQRLIAQRENVQQLRASVAQLVEEHQRLNGVNSQQIGTTSLGLGASSEAQQKAITDAVMQRTNGAASIKGFNVETNELTYTLKTASNQFTTFKAAIDRTNGSIMAVRGNTTQAAGVFETLGRKIKEYSYYFTGSMMIYRAIAWVREGITAIKDIDTALTELKKVTDATEESYEKFLDTAAKTADKVGSTIKDVVSSTADWARLGSVLAITSISPII